MTSALYALTKSIRVHIFFFQGTRAFFIKAFPLAAYFKQLSHFLILCWKASPHVFSRGKVLLPDFDFIWLIASEVGIFNITIMMVTYMNEKRPLTAKGEYVGQRLFWINI